MNKSFSLKETISSTNEVLMIISHRGEWKKAPENSIESMLLAAKAGADMVEIDVQKTNHDQLYLMHDDTTMQDQVLIKMIIDPANPDMSILDAGWYKSLIFMPVLLNPKPGEMADDAVRISQLFDAPILEISFNSFIELKETFEKTSKLGIRLWCNTLNVEHPLDFSDLRALVNPEEVWGTLLRAGVSAIQTDQTTSSSQFIGRDEQGQPVPYIPIQAYDE